MMETSLFSVRIFEQSESLISAGDFSEAVNILEPARNIFQSSYRYHLNLGEAYIMLDDMTRGISHLKKCLEIAPSNELATRLLIKCHLGYPLPNQRQLTHKQDTADDSSAKRTKHQAYSPVKGPEIHNSFSISLNPLPEEGSGIESLAALLKTLPKHTLEETTVIDEYISSFPTHHESQSSSTFDFDALSDTLINAKIPQLTETGDPTPISEQRASIPDDTPIAIPTRQLAEIFIKQGAYNKAKRVYEMLAKKEPHNASYFEFMIERMSFEKHDSYN